MDVYIKQEPPVEYLLILPLEEDQRFEDIKPKVEDRKLSINISRFDKIYKHKAVMFESYFSCKCTYVARRAKETRRHKSSCNYINSERSRKNLLKYLEVGKVASLKDVEVQAKKFDKRWKNKAELFGTYFKCDKCNHIYATMKHLQRHKSNRHRARKFTCKLCKTDFVDKKNYTNHISNQEPKRCKCCSAHFTCFPLLRNHVKVTHSKFNCDQCSYIGNYLKRLKYHRNSHTSALPCSDALNSATSHEDRASEPVEPKFKCEICWKTFKNVISLKRHQKVIHSERKFQCDHCKYQSNTKSAILRHLTTMHKSKVRQRIDVSSM